MMLLSKSTFADATNFGWSSYVSGEAVLRVAGFFRSNYNFVRGRSGRREHSWQA
jgi:hypothetical protein